MIFLIIAAYLTSLELCDIVGLHQREGQPSRSLLKGRNYAREY